MRPDAVNAMTFGAVEPPCVRPSGDMPACLEKLDRLPVTGAAHFQYRARIRSRNELTNVSFTLVRLRGISSVTPVAPNAGAAVGAGLKDRYDPA
jgi:hypothetical protein